MKKLILLFLLLLLGGCQTANISEKTTTTTSSSSTSTTISSEEFVPSREHFVETYNQTVTKLESLTEEEVSEEAVSLCNFQKPVMNLSYTPDDVYYPEDYADTYNQQESWLGGKGDLSFAFEYAYLLNGIKNSIDFETIEFNVVLDVEIEIFSFEPMHIIFYDLSDGYALVHYFSDDRGEYLKFGFDEFEHFSFVSFNGGTYEELAGFNYLEFVEYDHQTLINYSSDGYIDYQFIGFVDHGFTRFSGRPTGEFLIGWYDAVDNIEYTISEGIEATFVFISFFNTKGVYFSYDKGLFSPDSIGLTWELLEATGWDYSVVQLMEVYNTVEGDGVFVDDTNIFEWGQDRLNAYINPMFAHLGLRKEYAIGTITDNIINLSEYGMDFNHPEMTLEYLETLETNAYLDMDEKLVYNTLDFKSENIYEQFLTVMDSDIRDVWLSIIDVPATLPNT